MSHLEPNIYSPQAAHTSGFKSRSRPKPKKYGTSGTGPSYYYMNLHVEDQYRKEEGRDQKGTFPTSAPVMDSAGDPTAAFDRINLRSFRVLTWFYSLSNLPWIELVCYCFLIYMAINISFGTLYYVMCRLMSMRVSIADAFYFSVVTFAGNGGYEGEDPKVVTAGTHAYSYRTTIVAIETFIGITMSAMLTAILVTRASRPSLMRHRIVFSDFAAITSTPSVLETQQEKDDSSPQSSPTLSTEDEGEAGGKNGSSPWRLTFRIANGSKIPLIGANLALYLTEQIPSSSGKRAAAGQIRTRTREIQWECEEEQNYQSNPTQLLLWYPVTITHTLDESSPLQVFGYSVEELAERQPQLVAVVTATDGLSGSTVQARHCYRLDDMVERYHFYPEVLRRDISEESTGGKRQPVPLVVDYGMLNKLIPDEEYFAASVESQAEGQSPVAGTEGEEGDAEETDALLAGEEGGGKKQQPSGTRKRKSARCFLS